MVCAHRKPRFTLQVKQMGSGFYGQLTITDWLHDKKRVPLNGLSIKNAMYAADLIKASRELGRTAVVSYFLAARVFEGHSYTANNCRTMMYSAVRQRALCYLVQRDLEKYTVDPKYDKAFERDIKSIFHRSDHIYLIIQENLKLTRYWPYFEAVGFERLLDFEQKYMDGPESVLDVILPDMERWMNEHEAEIDAYMVKIQPEIERKQAFLANKKAAAKAEKEATKAAKKPERDEIKMLQEQKRKNDIARRKWEKEMDTSVRASNKIGYVR